MAYIGIDIGTSSCKAAVINESGDVYSYTKEEYDFVMPRKGWVELNPETIWEAVLKCLGNLTETSDVTGMCVSSFGEAFVLTDEKYRPLYNFITYADERCADICAEFVKTHDTKKIFDRTLVYPNQSFSLMKLIWFRKNRPELMKKAHHLFFADDYFNFLLCGRGGTDYGTASKSLMLNGTALEWDDSLLKLGGIKKDWLSALNPLGTVLGNVRKEVADRTGIPQNIVLYQGCHDQCCATLGAGIIRPGMAVFGEGSTESMNVVVDNSVIQKSSALFERKQCLEPFIQRGYYMLPLSFLTFGNSMRWFIKTLGAIAEQRKKAEETVYQYLDRVAPPVTDLVFVPFMSDVNLSDPDTSVDGSVIGLKLGTGYEEFYRALQQGLNFESRLNVEIAEEMGVSISYFAAAGGMTRSNAFTQMKADILQSDISVLQQPESGLIGLVEICAVADGTYVSFEKAAEAMTHIAEIYHPERNYEDLFRKYREKRGCVMRKVSEV